MGTKLDQIIVIIDRILWIAILLMVGPLVLLTLNPALITFLSAALVAAVIGNLSTSVYLLYRMFKLRR